MRSSITGAAFSLAFIALGSAGCAGSASAPADEESSDDALMSTTNAYYFVSRAQVSPPEGPDCLDKVNKANSHVCFGSVASPKANIEERQKYRDAIDHEQVVVEAKLVTFNGGAAAGSQMIASSAWISAASGKPTKPVYLVKSVQGALEAKRLNGSAAAATVSNLDLSAAGSAAEIASAQADLTGAGLVVSGDLQAGALVGERLYRHLEHVVTMYDSWKFEETPGDHLKGAVIEIPAGAQFSLSLTSYPDHSKVEADKITGFTAAAPLVISEDRPPPNGETYAFYNFIVPANATNGQTFAVHSTPAPGAVGDKKWDFGFTIKVGGCRATFPSDNDPRQCN